MTHTNGIKEYYNAIAQQFAAEGYSNGSLLPILKNFVSLFAKKPRILDFGCGAGYECMRLSNLGADVVGIDYSAEAIKIAWQKNPDCIFYEIDFRELPKSLGKFDGIIAIASFIHVSDCELELVFNNLGKIINPQGFLLIAVIEGQGISLEKSLLEHNGIKYTRTFYLHSVNRLNEVARNFKFRFVTEIILPEEESRYGWKCFLYQWQ